MSKRKYTDSNGKKVSERKVSRKIKSFHTKDIVSIQAKTDTQRKVFDLWMEDNTKSFFLYGSAGTGKTFLALYLALTDLLDKNTPYDNIKIIRSTVPTRDVGFLPGELDEKLAVYETPYVSIFDQIFPFKKSYENMKENGQVEFLSTSFLRGITLDYSIIVVDECQNMTAEELNTIMTRIGKCSKVIFCGDIKQTDLTSKHDKSGFVDFFAILSNLKNDFNLVKFHSEDIVRSGLVKRYLLAKEDSP